MISGVMSQLVLSEASKACQQLVKHVEQCSVPSRSRVALHQVPCDFERNFLRDVRSIFTYADVAVADEGKTCEIAES